MEPHRELAHVRGSILRKSTGQSPVPDFALLMMARGGRDLAANSCKAAAGEDIPIIPHIAQQTNKTPPSVNQQDKSPADSTLKKK